MALPEINEQKEYSIIDVMDIFEPMKGSIDPDIFQEIQNNIRKTYEKSKEAGCDNKESVLSATHKAAKWLNFMNTLSKI
jgi:hypothetical protein